MNYFLYVTLASENKVLSYVLDSENGKLKLLNSMAVSDRPAQLALDPAQKILYVGREGQERYQISAFEIEHRDGGLKFINGFSYQGGGSYLATDRGGKFLLSSDYFFGRIAVHSIRADGGIERTIQCIETKPGAHSIQTDPSNKFVFVPHVARVVQMSRKEMAPGPNEILQFRFDEETGRLTPNTPHSLNADDAAGPRHFCFHPYLDIAYFSNEQGGSVTAYRFNSWSGTLNPFQTVSTLAAGYQGRIMCSDIRLTPSGKFLYVPTRGPDNIACFLIDPVSGSLIRTGLLPTEPGTRTICVDPAGKFLFAAGEHSDNLATYCINQQSGLLEPLEVYPVGQAPFWLVIVKPATQSES